MKSTIVVGSIQKAKPTVENTVAVKIQSNLKKMKVGNFFEIKGLNDTRELRNLRASINYFTRKNSMRVETSFREGTLVVTKTKRVSETQKSEAV